MLCSVAAVIGSAAANIPPPVPPPLRPERQIDLQQKRAKKRKGVRVRSGVEGRDGTSGDELKTLALATTRHGGIVAIHSLQ